MKNYGRTQTLSDEALTQYSLMLGYRLSPEDCEHIRVTAFPKETVAHAVKDFLATFEGGNWK
jgi:hypothetical protein